MKFKLERDPRGIIVGVLSEPFSQKDCTVLEKGVEKFLLVGKTRIILSFSKDAATSEYGLEYIEKMLQRHKSLAKKMGGDIRYVLPPDLKQNVAGTDIDLESAAKALAVIGPGAVTDSVAVTGAVASAVTGASAVAGAGAGAGPSAELLELRSEVSKLRGANKLLAERLSSTLKLLKAPQTNDELNAALAHYKILAAEAEKNR